MEKDAFVMSLLCFCFQTFQQHVLFVSFFCTTELNWLICLNKHFWLDYSCLPNRRPTTDISSEDRLWPPKWNTPRYTRVDTVHAAGDPSHRHHHRHRHRHRHPHPANQQHCLPCCQTHCWIWSVHKLHNHAHACRLLCALCTHKHGM